MCSFSKSLLIIHEEKTKKVTTEVEVWICDPNYHKIHLCFEFLLELWMLWEAVSGNRKSVSWDMKILWCWLKEFDCTSFFSTRFSVFGDLMKHSSLCLIIYYINSYYVIQRVGIYPVNTAIHPFNNCGLDSKLLLNWDFLRMLLLYGHNLYMFTMLWYCSQFLWNVHVYAQVQKQKKKKQNIRDSWVGLAERLKP